MYAIIATGGKQYKVEEGDVVRVEKLGKEVGEAVSFDDVIAIGDEAIKVGEDVKSASVEGEVVENGKWKRLVAHPVLAAVMYAERILVGLTYLLHR